MAKKIDIADLDALKTLTLKDLVDDAVERKNKIALEFLEKASKEKITKERKKDGAKYESTRSIASIRSEYLETYLGYTPESKKNSEENKAKQREKQRAKQKEKKEKAREELFANAFASFDKK